MEQITGVQFPAYMLEPFTEVDPLKLTVSQDDKEIHLMTYRYAVPEGVQRKGVQFYIHGFGAYCEQRAFVFKAFAEQGYETFALDQRGCGNSEGIRGYLGSSATLYNDIYLFIYKVLEIYKINSKETPLFLIGQSLGGLLSFNLSVKHKKLFRGMALIVPFFKGKDETLYKYSWVFKAIDFINPKVSFSTARGYNSDEYKEKYHYIFNDPKKHQFALVSSLVMFEELQTFAMENAKNTQTPFIIVNAKNDKLVMNSASEDIFKLNGNPNNKLVEFEHSDHLTIMVEYDEAMMLAKEIIAFYDSIIIPSMSYFLIEN